MIESRYKIEYVLPDEDADKSSPFRVLWYFLLIPLVLLAVVAITYDFSLQNLSRDSAIFIEKAKVHIFNLGDAQPLEEKNNIAIKKIAPPAPKTVSKVIVKSIKKPITSTSVITAKPIINQDNIKISELTTKQELQLKSIQSQIARNVKLTQSLNKLSEQFVLEQVKNQKLNTQLADQEKDRIELEEQLDKILEDAADKKLNLEDLTIWNKKNKVVEQENPENKKPIQTIPTEILPKIAQELAKKTDQETVQEPLKEEKTGLSETDKIIAAMANITSDKNKNTEAKTTKELESKIISKEQVINIEKDIINESATSIEILVENKEPIPKPTLVTQEVELVKIVKNKVVKEPEKLEVKTEVTKNNLKEETAEKVKINLQTTNTSAVDDIIAAMRESKSSSNNTQDTAQKVDP